MHNSFIVADSSEAAAKEAGDLILSKVSLLKFLYNVLRGVVHGLIVGSMWTQEWALKKKKSTIEVKWLF